VRILHITPDYAPAMGGAELFIKEVSERLAARGHDVTVLTMNSRGTTGSGGRRLPAADELNGVRVHRLNNTYKRHRQLLGIRGVHRALGLAIDRDRLDMLAVTPVSIKAFLETLRARADVVAVVNWYHTSLAYQTGIARGVRPFALVGYPLFHMERPWPHAPLIPQLLDRCDGVGCMTDYEQRFVRERSSHPVAQVVGAGVDPGMFARANGAAFRAAHRLGDAPLVGYVGRMSSTKGVLSLLAAMQGVWRSCPEARLVLVGGGLPVGAQRADEAVRAAFTALSAADRARMVCLSDAGEAEKISVFDALDVFAMPSVAESFGISYLEAWMCRTPVIGSRIGSTECVIADGRDGLLVPPDSPVELTASLLRLLGDQPLRERMGAAGYEKTVANFTWDKVVDRVEALYRRALGTGGRARASDSAVA
jgi:glycosyltransferase involved in cell wall biosynthesis